MEAGRAYPINATGEVLAVPTGMVGTLLGVELIAGADTATLVLREVDGSGAVIARLSAPANTTAAIEVPRTFKTAIHATFTGTGPNAVVVVA